MDMGIKGSNNEPQGTNKDRAARCPFARKDNGDITGTLRSPPRILDRLFVAAGAQHSQSPITAGGRAVGNIVAVRRITSASRNLLVASRVVFRFQTGHFAPWRSRIASEANSTGCSPNESGCLKGVRVQPWI
jgi:hypothetical protein